MLILKLSSVPQSFTGIKRRWIHRWFDVLLVILFIGPIISPLFRATEWFLVRDGGLLARDILSRYICPTPERAFWISGFPMAVCARCWGATIGLWTARIINVKLRPRHLSIPLVTQLARLLTIFVALPWPTRLALCALPLLLWPVEIIGSYHRLWLPSLGLVWLNGIQAGFAVGLFCCSIWLNREPR